MSRKLKFGNILLAPEQCLAWRGAERIALSMNQTRVLEHLIKNRERLVEAQEIGETINLSEVSVRNVVRELRQKLGEPDPIRTVVGGGYIMTQPEATRA